MLIIGCDYHPGFQQIAVVDTETGECGERRLTHRAEAEQFYRTLKERSLRVRFRSARDVEIGTLCVLSNEQFACYRTSTKLTVVLAKSWPSPELHVAA